MTRRRIDHSTATHHWCQPREHLPLVTRRAFRADTRRPFPPPSTWIMGQRWLAAGRVLAQMADEAERQLPAMWLAEGFSGRQGPQDGDPRAVLGAMHLGRGFRCSCQIADHISDRCASQGQCSERRQRPGSTLGTVCDGRGYPDAP
jgi:hypothetical protein